MRDLQHGTSKILASVTSFHRSNNVFNMSRSLGTQIITPFLEEDKQVDKRCYSTTNRKSSTILSRKGRIPPTYYGNQRYIVPKHTKPIRKLHDVSHLSGTYANSKVMLPLRYSYTELENNSLFTLAALQVPEACEEVLKRHIMIVDNISYQEATKVFTHIEERAKHNLHLSSLPYKIGLMVSLSSAIASTVLVFDIETVLWFNKHFVTMDIPKPQDLETPLEVASWAWKWMGVPLGQISFILLCSQCARDQLKNLGISPYKEKVKRLRAERLKREFPNYDIKILDDYSKTII